MNKSPAFQFYPDDFLAGVSDMTQAEVGSYILLLCQQWNRGEIPSDPARLKLMAKGKVSDFVLSKFEKHDGSLKNKRLETVRKSQDEFRESKRIAGAKGLAKRWHSHSTAIAQPSICNEPARVLPIANDSSPVSYLLSPNKTPLPPAGVVEFPSNLKTPEFESAWKDWLKHLSEKGKGKRPTPSALEKQLKKCSDMGESRAIAAIENSIMGNWQGIFEPTVTINKTQPAAKNQAWNSTKIQDCQ